MGGPNLSGEHMLTRLLHTVIDTVRALMRSNEIAAKSNSLQQETL